MKIYELRKTASKNKKYKYIYELIIEGEIFLTRRSDKEYAGVWMEKPPKCQRFHWFKHTDSVRVVLAFADEPGHAVALTFEELVKFKNSSV